jgi:serine/threonine protein kinase
MLADEARLSVWLQHPNIVQILDFGRVGKTYYIAMEYVEGCDLCDLIRPDGRVPGRPMPLATALFVMTQVAEALAYAHRRCNPSGEHLTIIHRDVSPHNVLISVEGQVKLADFGLARASISVHRSFAGVIRGKFSYMPKEQAHGRQIDHRIDLFAAGVTLYEAVTGVKPYTSANLAQQLYQLEQPVPPPSAHVPDIPEEIDELTMQAICPDPEDRYQSADDLASDLHSALLKISTFGQEERQLTALVKSAVGAGHSMPDPLPHMSLADVPVTNDNLLGEEVLELQRTHYPEIHAGQQEGGPRLTPATAQLDHLPEEEEELDTSQFNQRARPPTHLDGPPARLEDAGASDDFDGKQTVALPGPPRGPSLPPAALEAPPGPSVDRGPRVQIDPDLLDPDTDLNEGLPPEYGQEAFLPDTAAHPGPAHPGPVLPDTEQEQRAIEAALDQVGLEPPVDPLASVAGSVDSPSTDLAAPPELDPPPFAPPSELDPDAPLELDPPPFDTLQDPEEAGRLAREALDDARTIQRSPDEALAAFQRALDERERRRRAASPTLTWKHWVIFGAVGVVLLCLGAAAGWLLRSPGEPQVMTSTKACPEPPACPTCPTACPACPQPARAAAAPGSADAVTPAPAPAVARADAGPGPRAEPLPPPKMKAQTAATPVRKRRPHRTPPPARRIPDRRVRVKLGANQGFLSIRADAKAKAYIDERQFAAPVPVKLPLKAGIHRVKVVFVETNTSSETKWVTVEAGKTASVYFSEIE